jgi:cyclase
MLRKRVIPVVLIDGYSVLKTIRFQDRRNQGNPIVTARTYNSRNVDELVLLDIDASKNNRSIDLNTIREIASECYMPLTVGGGIQTLEDINAALLAGADKVVINSAALHNNDFIRDAVQQFGAQCIVASVDVSNNQIYSHALRPIPNMSPLDFIKKMETLGVGEIFLTDVDRDGLMEGVNIELIKTISETLTIPLIYSGGVGKPQDCTAAIKAGASAIAAASIFHFTRYVPDDCKKDMRKEGIPIRLDIPQF